MGVFQNINNWIDDKIVDLNDSLNLGFEQISDQVTWLSQVGWQGDGGSQINKLNYSYTRQISQSGATINGHIAATLSAFWACAQMISTDIAKLPLNIYTLDSQGNKLLSNTSHPLHKVISVSPDGQIIAQTFWEAVILHTLVWGNGYALIGPRDPSNGQINHLEIIHPNLVVIRKDHGIRFYEIFPSAQDLVNGHNGRAIRQEEMFHLHGPGDGFSGWPIANFAKETLGITISLQELQAALFANGMDLGGTLTTTEEMDDIHRANMAEEWTATHSGASNRHKVAVLDQSTIYTPFDRKAVDSEVLESRRFQIAEIARFFRVPPHKLGLKDASTLDNLEQENLKYVQETLSPWIKRMMGTLQFRVFAEGSKFFPEIDIKPLTIGDALSTMEFWVLGIEHGMATPNMANEAIGFPTYPEGNQHYISSSNLQPVAVANMGLEKSKLAMETQELNNLQLQKNINNNDNLTDNNTGHDSAHDETQTPVNPQDNPKAKQTDDDFNSADMINIWVYHELIEHQLKSWVKREANFEERRQKKLDKFGDKFVEDVEETKRFYTEQTAALRECLVTYFEVWNMPEPKGFIAKWTNWQEIEHWQKEKAFRIANNLILHYTGCENKRDSVYQYLNPVTGKYEDVIIENGILKMG